jgi:hypothetical protein
MGITVNRGSESLNGYKSEVQTEDIPQVKAEVVEEEMFAAYEESARATREAETEGERVVLRNLIPDTEEDFKLGFRQLREHEYQTLGIPKNRDLYRTREDASKNLFKISASRVGEHIKELMTFKFPPGYLWDSYGLTPEGAAEIKVKILNTARTTYPSDDWSKYKRGDIKTCGVANHRYPLRVRYWEEVAKRSQEYIAWVETQIPEGIPEPEACEAEWVFDSEPVEEREERHSKLRSRIELVGQQTYQQIDRYFDSLKEKLLLLAEDKGIETRIAIDERYGQVALNPEITEDDEDL